MQEKIKEEIKNILSAVEKEYDEHEDCGYHIECVLTSQTLVEELEKIAFSIAKHTANELMLDYKRMPFDKRYTQKDEGWNDAVQELENKRNKLGL